MSSGDSYSSAMLRRSKCRVSSHIQFSGQDRALTTTKLISCKLRVLRSAKSRQSTLQIFRLQVHETVRKIDGCRCSWRSAAI